MPDAIGANGQEALLLTHLTQADVRDSAVVHRTSGLYVIPLVRAALIELAVFVAFCLARLSLHYLQPPTPWLIVAVRYLFGVALVVQAFLTCTYVCCIVTWLILAACLEPTRFLPYGVAAVALVLVGLTILSQMQAASVKLKAMVKAAFDRMMQMKLQQAYRTIARCLRAEKLVHMSAEERTQAMEDELEIEAEDEAEAAEDGALLKRNDQPEATITPADVFAQISDGEDEITSEQLNRLFSLLNLELTDNQKEHLFAFCDRDCSGTISEREFVRGWHKLVELFLVGMQRLESVSRARLALRIPLQRFPHPF